MSAATALAVFLDTIAATIAVFTVTAAAITVHVVDEVLDFFLCSLAVFGDKSAEEQRLTSQRVVQV